MSDKVVVRWSRDIPSHPTIGRQVVKYINPLRRLARVRQLQAGGDRSPRRRAEAAEAQGEEAVNVTSANQDVS